MILAILTYYKKGIINYFAHDRVARLFTLSGFLVVTSLLALFVYAGLHAGLRFIMNDPFFGQALALYVVELFFLVAFALMFVSAFIGGLVSLFGRSAFTLLLASPSFRMKATMDVGRLFFSSLWPLIIIVIPGIIAFARVFPVPPHYLVLTVIGSVLLVLIATFSALCSVYALAATLVAVRRFSRLNLIITGGISFALIFGFIWQRFHTVRFVEFFQAKALDRAAPDLDPILAQFSVFPSHSLVSILSGGVHGGISAVLLALATPGLYLAVLLPVFYLLTRKLLLVWQTAQEGFGQGVTSHVGWVGAIVRGARTPEQAFRAKEMLVFLRNTRGILWFCFIVSMWAIESGSGKLLTRGLGEDRVIGIDVPVIAVALQFALIVYFVAMITLRFVFPTFSEERKPFWIIRTSPVDLGRFFDAKFRIFAGVLAILAAGFAVLHFSIVGASGIVAATLAVLSALGAMVVVLFGLYLSARYPNNETDDPEMLSTTLPGLLFIFLSLAYGALGGFELYVWLRTGSVTSLLVYAGFSAIALFGLRRKGMEFARLIRGD